MVCPHRPPDARAHVVERATRRAARTGCELRQASSPVDRDNVARRRPRPSHARQVVARDARWRPGAAAAGRTCRRACASCSERADSAASQRSDAGTASWTMQHDELAARTLDAEIARRAVIERRRGSTNDAIGALAAGAPAVPSVEPESTATISTGNVDALPADRVEQRPAASRAAVARRQHDRNRRTAHDALPPASLRARRISARRCASHSARVLVDGLHRGQPCRPARSRRRGRSISWRSSAARASSGEPASYSSAVDAVARRGPAMPPMRAPTTGTPRHEGLVDHERRVLEPERRHDEHVELRRRPRRRRVAIEAARET